MRWTRLPWLAHDDVHLMRFVRSVAIAAVGSLVVFLLILWDFQPNPLRTALGRTSFSDFYDFQARALLDGHLHLPPETLGIEAFVHDGREYMYFPPGPALARIPLFLFTDALDGRLTAISMLLAWVATVVLVAMLTWRIRRILRGRAPLPAWEAASYGLLVVAVGAGSVLVYLAAMPWVYHEAYAWAVAAALACAFTLLGVIEEPSPRRILALSVALLVAVLSRATTGWAFGLATIATGVWFLTGRHGFRGARFGRLVLLAAAGPLLVGIGVNFAKFAHPYLFPLEDQVWTSVNQQRRDALAANGGDLVSLDLLPSTLTAYFRPDGIRVIPVPPFLTFPEEPAGAVGGGFLDQTYRTGSAVPFMPALVGLGTWGLVTAFRPRGPDRAPWVRLPILGAGAVCGAILVYGYISYRYVAEILPVLVVTSAVGLVDLGHLFMLRPARQRRWFLGGLAGLALVGVLANGAVAFTTVRLARPGQQLDRYLGLQEAVSGFLPGDPLLDMTAVGDDVPRDAPGEHLRIVRDCTALLVGQAETYWPWVVAEVRPLAFEVSWTGAPEQRLQVVELARNLTREGGLTLQRRSDGAYRVLYRSPTEDAEGPWTEPTRSGVQVVVEPNVPDDAYMIVAEGRRVFPVALSAYDEEWFRFQNLLVPVEQDPAELERLGLTVRTLDTPRPPRCARLLERLDR